jgi:hypothetical protein
MNQLCSRAQETRARPVAVISGNFITLKDPAGVARWDPAARDGVEGDALSGTAGRAHEITRVRACARHSHTSWMFRPACVASSSVAAPQRATITRSATTGVEASGSAARTRRPRARIVHSPTSSTEKVPSCASVTIISPQARSIPV